MVVMVVVVVGGGWVTQESFFKGGKEKMALKKVCGRTNERTGIRGKKSSRT